jgi:hypothetical protein
VSIVELLNSGHDTIVTVDLELGRGKHGGGYIVVGAFCIVVTGVEERRGSQDLDDVLLGPTVSTVFRRDLAGDVPHDIAAAE